MNFCKTIIYFISITTIIIFTHELGHLIVARLFNIKVKTFSIGFGKKLVSFIDNHGTFWTINLIPLGGYIQIEKEKNTNNSLPRIIKKMIIVIAGPISNFLLSFLILLFIFYYNHHNIINLQTPTINNNSLAKTLKLKTDNIILTVNQKNIPEILSIININNDKCSILSNIRTQQAKIFKPICSKLYIGLKLNYNNIKKINFKEAYLLAKNEIYIIIKNILKIFKSKNKLLENLSGPIKTAKIIKLYSSKDGWVAITTLVAYLSLNVGVINFLPILPFDGGNLLLYIFKISLKKKHYKIFKNIYQKLGLYFLFIIISIAIYNDIKLLIIKITL